VRRPLLLAAALALLLLPMRAQAMDMGPVKVSIGYSLFAPRELDVVTGDTVAWSNTSTREHTVTADDGSFDSGKIAVRKAFAQTFTRAGTVPYHCRLHAFMNGSVTVHDLLIDGTPAPTTPGSRVALTGREAPGLGPVRIVDDTGWVLARAAPDAMGHFRASFVPRTSTKVHASAGGKDSPAVIVAVRDLKVVTAVAGRTVRVRVDPARKGARILLQVRSREHFGWWPLARRRTDAKGRASFRVPGRAARRVRALVVGPDGWTPLATGRAVHVAKK
jgi:plastocyanin